MKYRVKLNEVLYFARFEEIEIVAIADHAPGYIDGAALFDNKKSAKHVADITCGTVVEVEENDGTERQDIRNAIPDGRGNGSH